MDQGPNKKRAQEAQKVWLARLPQINAWREAGNSWEEIAKQYGVSPIYLREALRKLERRQSAT